MFPFPAYSPDTFVPDPNWNTPARTGDVISGVGISLSDINHGGTSPPSDITYLRFNDDGTRLYVADSNLYCYVYSLNHTAYDLAETLGRSFNTRKTLSSVNGVTISEDGLNFYFTSSSSGQVARYTTTTAYDLASASFSESLDTSSQMSSSYGIDISPDGKYLYVSEDSNTDAIIYLYYMETPHDLSTAVYLESYDAGASDSNLHNLKSLKISPNGDYLWYSYIYFDVDIFNFVKQINRLALSNRFRLNSVVDEGGVDSNTFAGSPDVFGFEYPPAGNVLYFAGGLSGDTVYKLTYTDI